MTTDSRPSRIATVLRWPLGIAVVSWRYMWRTTPLHRSEGPGTSADLPDQWEWGIASEDGRQGFDAGAGPLLHRTYTVRIVRSAVSAAALIERVEANLNRVTPEMVDDLDAMLAQLRSGGAEVIDEIGETPYGRFGWAVGPEGNRFELWQPPAGR